ncbi:hypothetical protein BH20CHL6_BH20CHL6_04430 [soil metagenome]
MRTRGRLATAALGVFLLTACSSTPAPEPSTAAPPSASAEGTLVAVPDSVQPTVGPSVPEVSPSPSGSPTPPPTPPAEAQTYIVQPGDTLTTIARQFGLTVEQVLVANPGIENPDQIQAGDELLLVAVPPENLPPPRFGSLRDPTRDWADFDESSTLAPRYADLVLLEASTEEQDLILELEVAGAPPRVDPEAERITYTFMIDVPSSPARPDYQLVVENTGIGSSFRPILFGRTGSQPIAGAFPGSASFDGAILTVRLALVPLGSPSALNVIALSERRFTPDPSDPESADNSRDRLPDGEWRPDALDTLPAEARWLTISTGL